MIGYCFRLENREDLSELFQASALMGNKLVCLRSKRALGCREQGRVIGNEVREVRRRLIL